MASTKNPQNNKKKQKEVIRSEFLERAHGDVWQDRRASERARTTSDQPSRIGKPLRAHGSDKNSDRSQKHIPRRNTIQVVGWVKKPRSILINECAREWGITRSQAVARLIELGLENKIISANSSLLAQALRETLAVECRVFFARITGILFRMFILLCQVLNLQKNQLARTGFQKKLTTEQLDKILDWSRNQARDDVVRGSKSSEGSALDEAIGNWLELTQHSTKETEEEEPESN
jgi:hypothetical protein